MFSPAVQDDDDNNIAIIGMGCRLPGGADSPGELWRLLAEGRDAVRERPATRPELGDAGDGGGEPGTAARVGGFLPDVTGFDAEFFGVSSREADLVDPQHRLLLEVAWEALDHAGYPPDTLAGTATGVFAGLSYTEYMERLAGQPGELEGSVLSNGSCVAAGRISYLLGLTGPSMVLDTACSSSLVALHLACHALRTGECGTALAGGVSLVLSPRMTRSFERMNMLSATGRCRAFDEAADGFVRGEGAGMVVLRRLPDALAAGDRVLAVVRGSAVNQDGRSDGMAAPSPAAQRALLRQALDRARIDPAAVGMIEAHGTGTPVGDPIEFGSLAEVYGQGAEPCAITSVKTNLGHLEPAAGISGLIKAVLCLGRGQVPANLHFSRWNPQLAADAEGTRFFVPTELTSWPGPDQPRVAAVSSFGFSGTNAHVVIEQAPAATAPGHGEPAAGGGPLVLTVPASAASALPAAAERLARWLETDGAGVPLRDVGYTLTRRRSPGRGRLGVVAGSRDELIRRLRGFAAGQVQPGVTSGEVGAGIVRQPVWVFSGQGSQWAGMGRSLLDRDPAFTAALTEATALIRSEAGFSVLDVIRGGEPVTGCGRVQPVLFAVQYALAAMWRAHGVEPAGVIGHSMGEVAAAVVAGALTLADGVAVICRRSARLNRIAGAGAMASVDLDARAAEAELAQAGLAGSVSVAVLAAPGSTVVAGASAAVARLVRDWESRGIPARLIAVDVASHSPQVDPLLDDLAEALAGLRPQTPTIPFYSTVLPGTGTGAGKPPTLDAAYWCANLRRPVQFTAAIQAAAADRRTVYLEISPHPVVARAVAGSLSGLVADPVVLPTLLREDDELATFRTQLAAAHCAGVAVGWQHLYPGGELADVPPISFRRERHWVDVTPQVPRPRSGSEPAALPGPHTEIPGDRVRHTWHGDAGTAAVPWLADHQVHDRPVLPGAAYAALALTEACAVFGAAVASVEVSGLRFRELLPLGEHTEVRTVVTRTGDDTGDWEAYGRDDEGDWNRLATATVRRTGPVPPAPARPDRTGPPMLGSADPLYEGMRACGVQHGPAFAAVTGIDLSADGRTVWAGVRLPEAAVSRQGLRVHPVLADACAQVLAAVLVLGPHHGLLLPTGLGRLTVPGDPATAVHARAVVTGAGRGTVTGDVCLLDGSGRTMARLEGLEITQAAADVAADRWFVEPKLVPAPATTTDAATPGTWLICADTADDEADDAAGLAHALRGAGAIAELEPLPAGDRPLADLTAAISTHWKERPAPRGVVVLPPGGASPGGQGSGPAALTATRRLLAVAQAVSASWDDPPRLYVLTRNAPSNLAHGAVRGVVRVLACEHPRLRATQIDVARAEHAAGELLAGRPEDEVVLRGRDRYAAQLDYAPLTSAERGQAVTGPVRYGRDGFRLEAGRLGELGSLHLAARPRRAPGPGQIELRIEAAGMNFRDVLTVMGLLGTDDGARSRIGFECAGVVTATGPGVHHLQPGDRVLAFDPAGGAFGSFITVPAAAVAALPAQLSAVDAAGLPAAYLTAWYALRYVARVQPGERVLIHSATGGTGQAAIAVAQLLGADVLATAGSEAKRQYLRDQGIRHVMDSRTLDFAAQVREATGGEGADVVLNSLAGPAIRAGLESLRPFGRFVELGVRDIMADAPLGMLALRHNITLGTVDLVELRQSRPELFASLLAEVIGLAADGRLTPLPTQTFALGEARQAFTLMAGARHIGKVVLTVPAEGEITAVSPTASPARADGAYIVTGGLSGVGLATARWLALGGAGQVIVNGRSAPSPAAEATLAEMRAAGCDVTVVRGDIAAPGAAGELAATVAAGLRLRGVVHSAMVLDDAAVPNITEDQLRRVWAPKVAGAWELHRATVGHQPDWFVLYSSMASLIGNPGQGVYAAANSWLDSFAAWRSGQGLPTLAVSWGPWGQTGAATDFAARGYHTIPTADGLHALGTLLARGRTRTGVLPGHPDTWIPPLARSSALFSALTGSDMAEPNGSGATDGAAADGADVRAELAAAAPGLARRQVLEAFLTGQIQSVLGLGSRTLDPDTPLRSLGFDSLLAIELGSRLDSALGIKLGQKFVWTHPTVAALTDGIAGRLESDLAPDPA